MGAVVTVGVVLEVVVDAGRVDELSVGREEPLEQAASAQTRQKAPARRTIGRVVFARTVLVRTNSNLTRAHRGTPVGAGSTVFASWPPGASATVGGR